MATTKLTTIEDLEQISDDECRYDLIQGKLIRMAPAGWSPGRIAAKIAKIVGNFVAEHDLGEVGAAETGFILSRDPDVLLAPDVSFIRSDRLPDDEGSLGFLALAPDFVVEVISPSDSASYVTDKFLEYLNAGVQLVWTVHPSQKMVTVFTPDRASRIFTEEEELDGGEVLPGFTLNVAEIFA